MNCRNLYIVKKASLFSRGAVTSDRKYTLIDIRSATYDLNYLYQKWLRWPRLIQFFIYHKSKTILQKISESRGHYFNVDSWRDRALGFIAWVALKKVTYPQTLPRVVSRRISIPLRFDTRIRVGAWNLKVKFADISRNAFFRWLSFCYFFPFFPSSNPSRVTIFFFPREKARWSPLFDPSARIIRTFESEIRAIAYEIRGSSGFDCRCGMAQWFRINACPRASSLSCARSVYSSMIVRWSATLSFARTRERKYREPNRSDTWVTYSPRQGKFHYSFPISIPIESRVIPSIKEWSSWKHRKRRTFINKKCLIRENVIFRLSAERLR